MEKEGWMPCFERSGHPSDIFMLKSEIAEIKRLFNKDSNVITRIAGCYVDAEKNIKLQFKNAFYSLMEEEAFKYEEIFRKTLSGTPGKHLLNMEFTIEQEKEGSAHEFLLRLRESGLEEEELLNRFFETLIEHYGYPENYYIILIDILYDVPGKAKDNSEMEDASEEVYHALLCSICPVSLSKPGLSYHEEKRSIEHRNRDWVVGAPMHGFLFPAFHERGTDIHSLLYFSKKPEEIGKEFVQSLFGLCPPLPANEQKEIIQEELRKAFQGSCPYEMISNIHEEILEKMEENETEEEAKPLMLDKKDMLNILEKSGACEEAIKNYERSEEADIEVMASNILDKKKMEVRTAGINIKVDTAYMQRIRTMEIEGKKCIVIEIDEGVDINGMKIKA